VGSFWLFAFLISPFLQQAKILMSVWQIENFFNRKKMKEFAKDA
jgi:hypothetical protein